MKTLVERVRYARARRGLPMHVLSERAGLSNGYVSLLEAGTWPSPGVDSIAKIAVALGVSLDWLVLGRGVEPEWGESTDDAVPSIYFARWSDGEAIKIGFSARPRTRIRQLSSGAVSPVVLLATLAGTKDDERTLHRRFAHARIRGEWFRAVPELLTFIEEVKRGEAA